MKFSTGDEPNEGPSIELPWSHLDEEQFKRAKNAYGHYWAGAMQPTGAQIFKRLLFYVNYETGACYARRETIAAKIRDKNGKARDVKTISRYTTKYSELGIFDVVHAEDLDAQMTSPRLRNGNRTNRYIIDLDRYVILDASRKFKAVSNRPTDRFVTLAGSAPLPGSHPNYRHFYPGIGPADLPRIPKDELPALLAKELAERVSATTGTPGVDILAAERGIASGLKELRPEEMLLSIIHFGDISQYHYGAVWDAFVENHDKIMKDVTRAFVEREKARK